MAMLAEPRRKKRSLNLRGKNNWSDDPNKFGHKLMQKMGWTPGKGLGMNEDGAVDNVKVRFKDDNGGVGFQDKNDQWTAHEANFEELLRNLHGGDVDKSKLHSESSLEEKSKKLQSRLHYKKFTRGKDITKYSHKDLANIFGKKSLHTADVKPNPVVKEVVGNGIEEEPSFKLVAGGSMKDYFQSKMKNKLGIVSSVINNYDTDHSISVEENHCDVSFRGFSSLQTANTENGTDYQICESFNSVETSHKYICFGKATEDLSKTSEHDRQSIDESTKCKKEAAIDSDECFPLAKEVSKTIVSQQITFVTDGSEPTGVLRKKKSKKIKKMIFEQLNGSPEKISVVETGEDSVVICKKKVKKNKRTNELRDDNETECVVSEVIHNGKVDISGLDDNIVKKNKTKKFNPNYKADEIKVKADNTVNDGSQEVFKHKKRKLQSFNSEGVVSRENCSREKNKPNFDTINQMNAVVETCNLSKKKKRKKM